MENRLAFLQCILVAHFSHSIICGDKALKLSYVQGQRGLCNEIQVSLGYIDSVSKNRKKRADWSKE